MQVPHSFRPSFRCPIHFHDRKILYDYQENGYPIVTGLQMADGSVVKADVYVAALDVPGAKKLIPQPWRTIKMVPLSLDLPVTDTHLSLV